jgi:ABC transporter substrate binding protein
MFSRYCSVSSVYLSQGFLCPVHAIGCEAGVDLLRYGASPLDLCQRSAVFEAKILQGATPADNPIERPRKCELVLNLRTTQALGITCPPTLLFRAHEVLQ